MLRLPVLFARLPPFPELRVFLFLTLASSFAVVSIRYMFPALRKGFLFFFPRSVEDFSSFSPRMRMVPFFSTQSGCHWVLSYTNFYWVNMISFTAVSGKR